MNTVIEPTTTSIGGFSDRFSDERRPGSVVGRRSSEGLVRRGIDVEGVIGIDNGALRIQPLIEAGWGRASLVYDPLERKPGLALGLFMLNGHNTSQAQNLPDTFRERIDRWLLGSQTYRRRERPWQWLRSGRWIRTLRQMRWWWATHAAGSKVKTLDENLAVGWFPTEVPTAPTEASNAFIMHATGPENGELWGIVDQQRQRLVRGVQNLPIYYLIVLRENGAMYYASSVENAHGLGAYPYLRPLALDPFNTATPLYPGVHQSVLGQIGFRLDTRVYGFCVEHLPELSAWFGSAHAADGLQGAGPIDRSAAEVGGCWRASLGSFRRTARGATPVDGICIATVDPGFHSGLINVLCEADTSGVEAGLVWRYQDDHNYWCVRVDGDNARVNVIIDGVATEIARDDRARITPGAQQCIQVLDGGGEIGCYVQGRLISGSWIRDKRLGPATGVGMTAVAESSGGLMMRAFEAHPRQVRLPAAFDIAKPWSRKGRRVLVQDTFEGPAGDLNGRRTPVGDKHWRRTIGHGRMDLTGHSAVRIQGSVKEPHPGRTAYTIDWDDPGFADLEVTITPPGTARGQQEHGLCGFILWQDPDNYITINIWVNEFYDGASISCFFQVDGFEDLYDAIWSNVGTKVTFGVPVRLRVACDGTRYQAFVDDEPVLYRALKDVYPHYKDLAIRRVGLLANWEWGTDTGSLFSGFIARA